MLDSPHFLALVQLAKTQVLAGHHIPLSCCCQVASQETLLFADVRIKEALEAAADEAKAKAKAKSNPQSPQIEPTHIQPTKDLYANSIPLFSQSSQLVLLPNDSLDIDNVGDELQFAQAATPPNNKNKRIRTANLISASSFNRNELIPDDNLEAVLFAPSPERAVTLKKPATSSSTPTITTTTTATTTQTTAHPSPLKKIQPPLDHQSKPPSQNLNMLRDETKRITISKTLSQNSLRSDHESFSDSLSVCLDILPTQLEDNRVDNAMASCSQPKSTEMITGMVIDMHVDEENSHDLECNQMMDLVEDVSEKVEEEENREESNPSPLVNITLEEIGAGTVAENAKENDEEMEQEAELTPSREQASQFKRLVISNSIDLQVEDLGVNDAANDDELEEKVTVHTVNPKTPVQEEDDDHTTDDEAPAFATVPMVGTLSKQTSFSTNSPRRNQSLKSANNSQTSRMSNEIPTPPPITGNESHHGMESPTQVENSQKRLQSNTTQRNSIHATPHKSPCSSPSSSPSPPSNFRQLTKRKSALFSAASSRSGSPAAIKSQPQPEIKRLYSLSPTKRKREQSEPVKSTNSSSTTPPAVLARVNSAKAKRKSFAEIYDSIPNEAIYIDDDDDDNDDKTEAHCGGKDVVMKEDNNSPKREKIPVDFAATLAMTPIDDMDGEEDDGNKEKPSVSQSQKNQSFAPANSQNVESIAESPLRDLEHVFSDSDEGSSIGENINAIAAFVEDDVDLFCGVTL
ncbi:hypothetical protein BDR26DRAFT_917676 [Obelidium mucronatum]|nr:hypothetical protein BDR26DRAFT_917676 [Obelidium mucronatum]